MQIGEMVIKIEWELELRDKCRITDVFLKVTPTPYQHCVTYDPSRSKSPGIDSNVVTLEHRGATSAPSGMIYP